MHTIIGSIVGAGAVLCFLALHFDTAHPFVVGVVFTVLFFAAFGSAVTEDT